MSGHLPGKTSSPRASLTRVGIDDARRPKPGTKTTLRKTPERAEATLVSLGLQSPRRPTIEPEFDELLTRQRKKEEALLLAIDGALTRNDDASVEDFRLQLQELQQQGVVSRQSLASKNSLRLEPPGHAQQLQACRSKIEKELEAARVLTEELQAAKEFVQALEARIEASVARAESLAKELDALPKLPTFENVVKRNVVGDDVTHRLRSQESSAVGMSLPVALTPQRNSLQRLILQEKTVDSAKKPHHSTSPRSQVQSTKSHRPVETLKTQRQTIDLSSVKSATPKKKSDDSYLVPASPLSSEKRATLPTFGEWGGSQRGSSRPQGWQASVQSPRQSTQLATPRLGVVRKGVSEAGTNLVSSMAHAPTEKIEDARKTLLGIKGSHQNLDAAIQERLKKAAAARSESRGLEEQATELEGQAAILQKVNEGGTQRCQETIAALEAELARRASRQSQDGDAEPIEHGSVDEAETRFSEETFRSASYCLNQVLDELQTLAPEPVGHVGKKNLDVAAQSLSESLKPSGNQQDKVKAKIEEHSAMLHQFENLVRTEKAALQKWQDRANDESETSVTGVSDL
jgi:hypothetical protein